MKQTQRIFMIALIFLTAAVYKSQAQESCPATSRSGFCSVSDYSSNSQFGSIYWEMTAPTGHVHYDLTSSANSSGIAEAHVWTGINEDAYTAGAGYNSISNTITIDGTFIYFDGLVSAYNGSASVNIYTW
jgi:hypothetical protein